ncbi:MAG TPA: PQQ-binding-like beta-propeller repeat protein [Ktedonobacterales bacterium]
MRMPMRARLALLCALALCPALLAGCGSPPRIPPHTVLYMNSQGDGFSALDGASGRVLWTASLGGNTLTPVYADGLLFSAGYWEKTGVALYALDPASGAVRWQKRLQTDGLPAGLQISGDVLYLSAGNYATHDAALYAVRPQTGEVLWRAPVPEVLCTSLLITGGRVYFATSPSEPPTSEGAVLALDAKTGARLWRAPLTGDPYSTPVLAGGNIVLSVDGGWVVALRPQDGAQVWRYQPPNYRVGLSSVDTADGLLYVVAERTLYALDAARGTLRWQRTVDGSSDRSHQQYLPVMAHGTLYLLAGNDERVYALRPTDGSTIWAYDDLGYARSYQPIVDAGIVYFVTGYGGVDAVSEADGGLVRRYDAQLYGTGVLVRQVATTGTATPTPRR